mgnify:CR=1 FL=1
MADFEVQVQNVEENQENISVTGVVNGVQAAAVVKAGKRPAGLSHKQLERWYAEALVDAFQQMKPKSAGAAAIKVSR